MFLFSNDIDGIEVSDGDVDGVIVKIVTLVGNSVSVM